jgi:hypothetical protein
MTLRSGRLKKDLGSKTGTSVRVKLMKRKYCLIKNDITRDVHTILGNIKTFESLVKITISQENTLFGAEL